jgi:hypothetical protein
VHGFREIPAKWLSFISCKNDLASVIEQTQHHCRYCPAVINKHKFLRNPAAISLEFEPGCYHALT